LLDSILEVSFEKRGRGVRWFSRMVWRQKKRHAWAGGLKNFAKRV